MNTKTFARSLLLTAVILTPGLASAQRYYTDSHGHRHYSHARYRDCRRRANNGTAIGAVSGGVLGATLGGGVGNTLLGAGAGAVAGHVIAKHGC